MQQPQKFLFDRSFDAPDAEPASPAVRTRRTVAAEEVQAAVAAARAEGAAEGRAAALAEAAAAAEARSGEALRLIADALGALLADTAAATETRAADAVRLVLAVIRRMAPTLCRGSGFAEIETVVGDSLRRALDEPRLVLRVADTFFDEARTRVDALARAAGFAGRVIVLADAALMPGDCRVEWADGGAERDAARLWREIEGTLVRALNAAEPQPAAELPAADAA